MYEFNYHKPGSLADAAGMLAGNEDAKLLAGGHTYIPTLKQRLAQPSDVVDISGLSELQGISEEAGGVTIGAMTRHVEVATSDVVKRVIPALADLADGIGDPQVRNRGTLGGSIANNDPAADYPAALVGLGATVRTNKREIGADDFFTGMFETALDEDEIVTAVHFPAASKAAYEKFPNPASRYAIVGAFVAQTSGGARVAITGAGTCVFRHGGAEQALAGNWSPDAVSSIETSPNDLNSDIHASNEYRAHLVGVMVKRAVAKAG